ncbi:MAG: hypothetical protein R3B47_00645 [Bacteroidia bacterium]
MTPSLTTYYAVIPIMAHNAATPLLSNAGLGSDLVATGPAGPLLIGATAGLNSTYAGPFSLTAQTISYPIFPTRLSRWVDTAYHG